MKRLARWVKVEGPALVVGTLLGAVTGVAVTWWATAHHLGQARSLRPIAVTIQSDPVSRASEPGCTGRCEYDTDSLVDDQHTTAWAAPWNPASGATLTYRFSEATPVTRLRMWPGWQRTDDCLRLRNDRPKTVVVAVGSNRPITWHISDASDEETLSIPDEVASVVTVHVIEVFPGVECDGPPATDLAISGLFVEGLFY
jgi:hypothetical protein